MGKSGFSGDCQILADTAMYLMDCYPVYRKWPLEQQATQYDDGCVRQVVPDGHKENFPFDGWVGWRDSIEIVPYKLWRHYDDDTVVRENYDCLKRYFNFCLERNKTIRDAYQWLTEDLQPFFADQGMH
jgi:alpha-L-rhamnosidase